MDTLIEYRKLADGTELEIQHAIRPHKAKLIKQIPGTKKRYRAKNAAGGIKCAFTRSREYNLKGGLPSGIWGVATEWGA